MFTTLQVFTSVNIQFKLVCYYPQQCLLLSNLVWISSYIVDLDPIQQRTWIRFIL